MKLQQWAAREGVPYQTAWRWRRDRKPPVIVVEHWDRALRAVTAVKRAGVDAVA